MQVAKSNISGSARLRHKQEEAVQSSQHAPVIQCGKVWMLGRRTRSDGAEADWA